MQPANCQRCGGRQRVVSSKRHGAAQVQYLECTGCHHKRSRVVDAAHVWRRKK
jgi:hypothetical protein